LPDGDGPQRPRHSLEGSPHARARQPHRPSDEHELVVPVGEVLSTQDVRRLERTVGNHVTTALVHRAAPPIQRALKIDDYEWSWKGIPVARIGFRWATGALELFNKLKQSFETDLPAAIKALDNSGEKDLQKLATPLRTLQAKYDDKPLVYKKATGKLSGEDLDSELSTLLTQADKAIKARKLNLAVEIRTSLGKVGGYLGQLTSFRPEFERISTAVPKGSDGATLDFATLRSLATSAATVATQMQTEITRLQSAKLTQNAAPAPTSKSKTAVVENLVKQKCKERNWKEAESSAVLTDPSEDAIKLEVLEHIIGTQINTLNLVMGRDKLTLAKVREFLLDHGIRTIGELNKQLVAFQDAAALETTLIAIGIDGLEELLKRKVPGAFIAQHAGESLVDTLQAYTQSIATTAAAARPYDPIMDGVDPTKDPLQYSKLEAYLTFHMRQMHTKGVTLDFDHTYHSRYDGENGIGAEYWPNGTSGTWVVHVHRGPQGGLKVGSVKAWDERRTVGHSQKLTVDQLTEAGVPQVDATRTH